MDEMFAWRACSYGRATPLPTLADLFGDEPTDTTDTNTETDDRPD